MDVPEASEKRRFAAAYLRCFDPEEAAAAVGARDGIRLLTTPAVKRELELQKSLYEVSRQDILRRLAQLAFGRANDCVRLVLEDSPDLSALDLSLLSEVKLIDRIRALERLLEAGGDGEEADAFFAAAAGDGECL